VVSLHLRWYSNEKWSGATKSHAQRNSAQLIHTGSIGAAGAGSGNLARLAVRPPAGALETPANTG